MEPAGIKNTILFHDLKKIDAWLSLFVFIAAMALYIRTLAPDLLLGDSGEFQTVMYTLGMTHPTGYPVFVLIGRLFTLLPVGELAWRANLFVAVQAALTPACIYLIVRMLTGWRLAAIMAAFVMATNPLFWYYAIIAELYVPASALISMIVLLILLWRKHNNPRYLACAGLLGGLALGVHSTVALIAPGVILYLLLTTHSRKDWVYAAGGATAGLALFALSFLLLDAINSPAGYYNATVRHALSAWSLTGQDFNTPVERFEFQYAARQFRSQMFADPARVTPVNSLVYVQVLQMTFLPVSLLLMLAGVFTSFLQYWREALMFLLGWAVLTFFAINYEVHDFYVFFLPGYVFLAVWVGIGLGALMSFARRGVGRISILAKWSVPIANCVGLGFLFLIFLGVGGNLVQSWQEKTLPVVRGTGLEEYPYPMDNPSQPHDKARALINALEDNAIVFTNWDMLFPYYFVAHVESGRKQMDFHETYPQDGMTSLADSTLAYITSNMDRPIYFSERLHGTALKRLTIAPVNKNGIILYQVLGVRPE